MNSAPEPSDSERAEWPETTANYVADLENRLAYGVHTCHDHCQRPMCKLQRENRTLQAKLAALREALGEVVEAKRKKDEHPSSTKSYGDMNRAIDRAAALLEGTT